MAKKAVKTKPKERCRWNKDDVEFRVFDAVSLVEEMVDRALTQGNPPKHVRRQIIRAIETMLINLPDAH